jgi:hypothetical protein
MFDKPTSTKTAKNLVKPSFLPMGQLYDMLCWFLVKVAQSVSSDVVAFLLCTSIF